MNMMVMFRCFILMLSLEIFRRIFQLGFKEYLERDGIALLNGRNVRNNLPVARFAIFFETGNTENLRRISIEHIGQK